MQFRRYKFLHMSGHCPRDRASYGKAHRARTPSGSATREEGVKNRPRRTFLQLAAGVAALPTVSRIARAQPYPARPISMIVPFPAGGPADLIGRVVAERMKRTLGQTIIIENVGGADGNTGTGRVARAKPDGYTIGLGHLSTHVLNGAFYSLPYDVLNDFVPISPLLKNSGILYAKKTLPAKDLNELIVWLRVNPDKAAAATFTSTSKLLFAYFRKETGTQFSLVPYRGGAPAMQDLIAGQIDLLFSAPARMT